MWDLWQDAGMILLAKAAITTPIGADTSSIQWMPPGIHQVRASRPDGKVVERTVLVDEEAANVVRTAWQGMMEAARDGSGDAPYLDFDHLDHDASAWVVGVAWGGDDPKTGGIRIDPDWSADGRAKVQGRSYRRFSPCFQLSEPSADGVCRVVGTSINMGGIVNRAAFQSIAPLLGKDGFAVPPELTQPTNTSMTDDDIKALQAELAAVKTENEELKKTLTDMQAKAAEDAVEKACEEGRIAPDLKASWKEMILGDPKAELLLAKQPVNPVFAQQYKPADNKDAGAPLTGEKLLAKHAAITDPSERLNFYRDNEKGLIAARG